MSKPKAGDTVRVQKSFWGNDIYIDTFVLEEFNFCLGYYEIDGPKSPCNFTPLCNLVERAPDATEEYWSNYGPYYSDYINTFEVISNV
ncbi:MAG TPA: hypothetical protein DDW91_17720 [Shewanella frigidimarina]|nr:hypothetical protein [Shewanella frigidimarina]